MKKLLWVSALSLSTAFLLTGCIGLQFGGDGKHEQIKNPTVGQQLVDLKAAKDAGALTDAEYLAQKNRILCH